MIEGSGCCKVKPGAGEAQDLEHAFLPKLLLHGPHLWNLEQAGVHWGAWVPKQLTLKKPLKP